MVVVQVGHSKSCYKSSWFDNRPDFIWGIIRISQVSKNSILIASQTDGIVEVFTSNETSSPMEKFLLFFAIIIHIWKTKGSDSKSDGIKKSKIMHHWVTNTVVPNISIRIHLVLYSSFSSKPKNSLCIFPFHYDNRETTHFIWSSLSFDYSSESVTQPKNTFPQGVEKRIQCMAFIS